jgi:hypothetical protein
VDSAAHDCTLLIAVAVLGRTGGTTLAVLDDLRHQADEIVAAALGGLDFRLGLTSGLGVNTAAVALGVVDVGQQKLGIGDRVDLGDLESAEGFGDELTLFGVESQRRRIGRPDLRGEQLRGNADLESQLLREAPDVGLARLVNRVERMLKLRACLASWLVCSLCGSDGGGWVAGLRLRETDKTRLLL